MPARPTNTVSNVDPKPPTLVGRRVYITSVDKKTVEDLLTIAYDHEGTLKAQEALSMKNKLIKAIDKEGTIVRIVGNDTFEIQVDDYVDIIVLPLSCVMILPK